MVWHKPAMEQEQLDADLVPLVKAAELLGVRRQTLNDKLRRRGLVPVRRVVRGRVLLYLPQAWLDALGQAREPAELLGLEQLEQRREQAEPAELLEQGGFYAAPAEQLEQRREQVELLRAEVAELRASLDAARAEVHALGGKLAGAEYVERATGRRCDKLEQRAEAIQAELVEQARELGKRDALVALLREQASERSQRLERLEEAAVDPGPAWWRILRGG